MIYEMRIYTLCPGGIQPWLDLYEEHALPVLSKVDGMSLVGYFKTETGQLNRIVHIWSYADLAARSRAFEHLGQDTGWIENFSKPARAYLVAQETTLMSPVRFSPLP